MTSSSTIQKLITEVLPKGTALSKPLILNLSKKKDRLTLERLIKRKEVKMVSDTYQGQLKELFEITYPKLVYQKLFEEKFSDYLAKKAREKPLCIQGRWIYFPWNSSLTHILEEEKFFLVRTARNKLLISTDEQNKFYNSTIGIAGLSLGNSIALSLALLGGGRYFKLADYDSLALSNLNRMRTGINNLGVSKVELTAREIYSINPYAKIETFLDGIQYENIEKFFRGARPLNLVIDEIDSLPKKYLMRLCAKKYRVPLLMTIDNANSAIVEIERYDQKDYIPYFKRRLMINDLKSLDTTDKKTIGRLITQYIGGENISTEMQKSLLNIGDSIVSWPQLGSTATLNGAIAAYCAKKILLNEPILARRVIVSLDKLFIPEKSLKNINSLQKRQLMIFKKKYGIK